MGFGRADRWSGLVGGLALAGVIGLPALAWAQSTTTNAGPEVFAGVGVGKVIYRDQTFADVGGGVTMRFRSGLAWPSRVRRHD